MGMDNSYPTAKELLQQYESHGNIIAEPKFDGLRALIICDTDKNEVVIMSRHGKERKNFPTLNKQFENLLTQLDQSMVFDGEIMSDKFNAMMKQVHREQDANTDDATIFLYDIIPLENFIKGFWNKPISNRKELLEQFNYDSNIKIMEYKKMNIIDNPTDLIDFSNQNFNKGHEGTIVKNIDSIYTCNKSSAWFKIKTNFIEMSLPITDVDDNGTLIVEGKDVDYGHNFIKTKVESGFLNVGKDKLIGQIIEVRGDDINLKNPKFIKFRGFTIGEKI
jgi:ATP-dependent DNA ligase